MKPRLLHVLTYGAFGLVMPATADVIYSNLQNIAIPATFDGLYLNVETGAWNTNMAAPVSGWDINPFYGGRAVANSPGFQPVRSGTASDSPILNLAEGVTVGSGSVFSTATQGVDGENPGDPAYGGSRMLTGSGGNFTDGTEGYIGFQLNGTDYGSMRVVLTNNTSGAMIKDWAYDTSGAPVVVGAIKQVGQDIVLSSGFTLASALNDSGGGTNLVKNGTATNILSATSTYTGETNVNQGKLLINGSISTSLLTTVDSGASLGGNGTVGALTVSGILAPGGDGVDIQTLDAGATTWNGGSVWNFDLGASAGSSDQLAITGNFTKGAAGAYQFDFMGSAPDTWGNVYTLLTWTGTTDFIASNFTFTGLGGSYTNGTFALSGNSLQFTAIPEPTTALAGILLTAGLLRRRR